MSSIQSTYHRMILIGMTSASVLFAAQPLSAAAADGVLITGTNTEFASQTAASQTMQLTRPELCASVGMGGVDAIAQTMTGLIARITPRLDPGAAAKLNDISNEDIFEAINDYCTEPENFSTSPFKITYASCRMTMDSAGQMLDIVLPPDGSAGRMDMVDFSNREIYRMSLQRDLEAADMATGGGWGSELNIQSGTNGGTIAGYPTTKYPFSYSGGLGPASANPAAGMVTSSNSGTVWIANPVTGIDIVQSFYKNMSREVDPAQANNSFVGGLINNLVKMLEKGMPLKMDQTVESKVMGKSMISGRSKMEVYKVSLMPIPGNYCAQKFVPDDFTIRDISQEISEAMGSAGTNSSNNDEMAKAMSEAQKQMNEAMKQMTPEQREMMEKMGLGKMMGGSEDQE